MASKFALSRSIVFRDTIGEALLRTAQDILDRPEPASGENDLQADAERSWANDVLSGNCLRWIDAVIFRLLANRSLAALGEAAAVEDVAAVLNANLVEICSLQLR